MPAIHKSTVYKPGNLPNPFQKGQDRAYADILQDKMNEMRWWRGFVGIGILVVSAVNFIFFVVALSTQKTVPVLINVMPTGEAAYLGEVRQNSSLQPSQIPEAAILFQVKKFVTNIRSVSTDADVLYNNIDDCYYMITGSYEPVFTRMLRSASPFDLVGKFRRTVEIESALKITGNSYQIDWVETVIDSGSQRKAKMRALATVKIISPDSNLIKRNPLGILIDNYEMAEL